MLDQLFSASDTPAILRMLTDWQTAVRMVGERGAGLMMAAVAQMVQVAVHVVGLCSIRKKCL